MAIVSITEAAQLAGVSRGTLYNRIKSGELSRSGDGVDTSELMRVFGSLSRARNTKTDEHPLTDNTGAEAPFGVSEQPSTPADVQLTTFLASQLEIVERERVWLRELVEAERQRTADREQELSDTRTKLDERERYWSDKLTSLQALLPAPEPVRRKRFLGLF
jgi:hypothetical protein